MLEYFIVVLLLLLAVLFVAFSVLFHFLVGIKPKVNEIKQEPFECGSPAFHQPGERVFQIKYSTVAILFVIFDLEIILLYPWAVSARGAGGEAMVAGAFFISLLILALIYIWRKGLLNWQ